MTIHDEPRFCTYCAAPLKPGAPFCAECGRAVPIHVDRAASSAPAQPPCRFCGAATQPEDRFCPVCGHATPPPAAVVAGQAEVPAERDGGLLRRIVVIAVVVALLSGGGLGLLVRGLFGGAGTPLPSASPSPGILVEITLAPTLGPTLVPSPSQTSAAQLETPLASEVGPLSPTPVASPSGPVSCATASPSAEPTAESPEPTAEGPSPSPESPAPCLESPSPAFESPSPLPESPAPTSVVRSIAVGETKTDPPRKGNFQVTLQRIDVLGDGSMRLYFHVKNVRHVDDCVKLSSDGVDDFLVDSADTRYVPTGWATADGPLPFDRCGPTIQPGDEWDYFDVFPALDDPRLTFDLTIYHGDLIFSGLSVAP